MLSRTEIVCRAIIVSSSVGMTNTRMRERSEEMIVFAGAGCDAVEFDAEPFQAFQHALADAPGMLADAAAEHERVEALQHGREAAQFAADAEDEISIACCASGLSDASSSRMSCETPDRPFRPDSR